MPSVLGNHTTLNYNINNRRPQKVLYICTKNQGTEKKHDFQEVEQIFTHPKGIWMERKI